LSAIEDLIAKILTQRKDLTREQIENLIEEKKHEAQDLLSEEGAARLVAEELLVEMEPVGVPTMMIRDVVAGLNDVSLTGKVVATEPPKQFLRQNGSTGRVTKILLADETGKIGCVVWDEKVDLILKEGDITGKTITIRHGYTRAGLGGEVELNAGERGEIVITSETAIPETVATTLIADINEPVIELNLLGVIHSTPRFYEFDRDGQKGTVLRTVLADSTGSIPLVAWNERAEELRYLKRGHVLRIQGGRLRRHSSGRLEIHLETRARATLLEVTPESLKLPEVRFCKISELKPSLPTVNLIGRIVGIGDPQQVQRKSGETVGIARMLVADETGMISVSLWDDKAELALKLKVGDTIRIEDAAPTLRLGQVSLNMGRTASIQKVEGEQEVVSQVKINKISEALSSSELTAIEGEITETPETREVTTARGEKIQVTSTRIRDDTGHARVSFWRAQASEAGRLQSGWRIRVYGLWPRTGLAGETEFSTVQASRLEVVARTRADRPRPEEFRQFISLKENEQVWARAIILDAGENAALTCTCLRCEEPVVPSDGHFVCRIHGSLTGANWLLAMRMRLDDGTDTIAAEVRTKDPQSLIGKSVSWAQKEILAKGASTVALPIDATGKLAGMRMEGFGVTRRDPQTGKLVLYTDKVFLRE